MCSYRRDESVYDRVEDEIDVGHGWKRLHHVCSGNSKSSPRFPVDLTVKVCGDKKGRTQIDTSRMAM